MRILIADDFEPLRTAVAGILTQQLDWEVCGEAGNGTEALRLATELNPDVVLLDISMPGIDGLQAARLIHENVPSAKIVILSHHDPAQVLNDARKVGALECIDKGRIATDLIACIQGLQTEEESAA